MTRPYLPRPALPLMTGLLFFMTACGGSDTTTPVTHDVLISGSLEIPATYLIDLDAGVIPTSETQGNGDLWNESIDDTHDQLSAANNTTFAAVGTTEPGYAGCASASLGTANFSVEDTGLGTWFCVKTTANHLAEVKLTKTATTGDHNINVSFTTWK